MPRLSVWSAQVREFVSSRDAFCLLLVILLLAFHLVNNWIYLSTRVTLWGWDQPSHLLTTLRYHDVLEEPSLRAFFEVLTRPWNRPPLPWLPAVLFYRLFGVSTDVALMANAVFVAVLLFSVYGVGKRMYGHGVGILAAFLVSVYPIIFSLSRFAYPDFALTALVGVNMYLLLLADNFRSRGGSLLLGLGLGLGLLTKWQFMAFVGAPLAYVIVASGSVSDLKNALREGRAGLPGSAQGGSSDPHSAAYPEQGAVVPSTRRGLIPFRRLARSPWFHALCSAVLNLAWYLPNWDRMSRFALGGWVLLLSWLLVTLTLFVLSRSSRQATNLLSAFLVGAALASVWSLPNVGYLSRFATVAYGGANLRGRSLGLLNPATYARYLQLMLSEQLSPLFFSAFLLSLLFLAYRAWQRSGPQTLRDLDSRAWILTLWFLVPLLVFTLSLATSARFNVALLPSAAIITAGASLKPKRFAVRSVLLCLLVVGGLTQFFALSYDELDWLRARALMPLPVNVTINLLAKGQYIELPASGRTDPGYHIVPQVLDQVMADGLEDGREEVQLGLLANNPYVNSLIVRYMMYRRYPGITLRRFESGVEEPPFYPRLFECDYLLLMSGWRDTLSEDALEAVATLESPPSLFHEAFELRAKYTVPNDETAYLYKKRHFPHEGNAVEAHRELAGALGSMARQGDALVVEPAAQVGVLGRYYTGSLPVYAIPEEDFLENTLEQELQRVMRDHRRILAVFGRQDEVDPYHSAEQWLNRHGYRAWDSWYDGVELVLYGTTWGKEELPLERSVDAYWEEGISLEGYGLSDDEIQAGGILRLTFHWRALNRVDDNLKVFVHLLDEGGSLVAQRDSEPVGGSRPMRSWDEGEAIEDNYGLLVPATVVPGHYTLLMGMYSPLTGDRLMIRNNEGTLLGDSLLLNSIAVVGE